MSPPRQAAGTYVGQVCQQIRDDLNDPDECEKLYQQIKRQVDLLKKRYYELKTDKLDLYNTRPTGRNSFQGHQQQFSEVQSTLRRLLIKASSLGCQNYQYDAWFWATRSTPMQPGTR